MKTTVLALGAFLVPALWLNSTLAKSADENTARLADQSIGEARSSLQTASASGAAWRDTGKLLQKAEKAQAAGDFALAQKLSETAAFQGRMGISQAEENRDSGNPAYLYQ